MPPRPGRFATIVLLGGWLLIPDPTPLRAQTADDLFNDTTLHEIRLSIHSRDLATFRERYRENIFFPADLQWRGLKVRNVGVRSRGGGSRNPDKLGIFVDFNRYTRGQQFLGMNGLVLDNLYQDASLMRENLAMAVFRRMGQAAPRESFARVFINNVYQGLYGVVEAVDATFAARVFGDANGYLYEYHWLRRFFMDYPGDDYATYKEMFEARSHELDADSTLYGQIRELFREINGPDDAVWLQRVGERIDLEQFMTHVAIQGFLGENDGIQGYEGINNFYLYRSGSTGRHRIIPWDVDQAFAFFDASILRDSDFGDVVLFQRAYAQPDLKTIFLNAAERCANLVVEDNWLANEVERYISLISAAVLEDTRKRTTNDDFKDQMAVLRSLAVVRPQIVLAEVARLR